MARRVYSDKERGTALAFLDAYKGNYHKAAKHAKVPLSTLWKWAKGVRAVVNHPDMETEKKEARGALADMYEDLAYDAVKQSHETVEMNNSYQAAMVSAIATDKMQLLRGQATQIVGTPIEDLSADDKHALRDAIRRDIESAAGG